MGVVVTLAPSPSGDQPLVVVGACAAVKRDKSIKELNAVGLTSPNWEASVTCVLQHYPAGTSAAGIWVRVEQQEDREAESRAHLILKHTKLKVSAVMCHIVEDSSLWRIATPTCFIIIIHCNFRIYLRTGPSFSCQFVVPGMMCLCSHTSSILPPLPSNGHV